VSGTPADIWKKENCLTALAGAARRERRRAASPGDPAEVLG
jgi:hypothetical protein